MKDCYTCKKTKSLSEYPPDKANKDGHKGQCRNCLSGFSKKYPKGYQYAMLKKRREIIKFKYGIGAGSLWRYGKETMISLYNRDKNSCTDCKGKDYLTVHHLDGKGRGLYNRGGKMNNELSNLILLCRICHGRRDGKKGKGIRHRKATRNLT